MSSSTHDSTVSPDSNNSKGSSFFDTLLGKPMALVSILIAVIVIAAVFVGIRSQKEARTQAAGNALFHAQKTLENETKAFAASVASAPAAESAGAHAKKEAPAPSPVSVQFKKTDVDAKFPESIKKFKSVMDQYPGTRAAFEAQLAIGSLYSNHGEPAKAVTWFQQASESAPRGHDQAEALAALGYAHEGAGKYAEAIASYEKAASVGDTTMKGELLLSVARNQDLSGKSAKARETYDQIIKQFPNSEQAHTAEFLKAQLK